MSSSVLVKGVVQRDYRHSNRGKGPHLAPDDAQRATRERRAESAPRNQGGSEGVDWHHVAQQAGENKLEALTSAGARANIARVGCTAKQHCSSRSITGPWCEEQHESARMNRHVGRRPPVTGGEKYE